MTFVQYSWFRLMEAGISAAVALGVVVVIWLFFNRDDRSKR
jgi:hypothetical protein